MSRSHYLGYKKVYERKNVFLFFLSQTITAFVCVSSELRNLSNLEKNQNF